MLVHTPDPAYAEQLLGAPLVRLTADAAVPSLLPDAPEAPVHGCTPPWRARFDHLLCERHAARSHYDLFVARLGGPDRAPDRTLAVAGSGDGFHGLRDRPWAAAAGNLHLVVAWRPGRAVPRFVPGFVALPAVAAAECLARFGGAAATARIKWPNDLVIGRAKLAGVLTHAQAVGDVVTDVILGIGLNVGTVPAVAPDPFVPAVTRLADHAAGPVDLPLVLAALAEDLDRNYRLLRDGGWRELLDRYRALSCLPGRAVTVVADGPRAAGGAAGRILAQGIVEAIGDDLELWLRGRPEPVRHGRLVLDYPEPGY